MDQTNSSPFLPAAFIARASTGLSAAEAAYRIGIKSSMLKAWEEGRVSPPEEALERLKEFVPKRRPEQGKFTFIDLFAGIGGLRRAFERAGGECVFTSEWNRPALETYLANFGADHPVAGDITKVKIEEIPDHDVLVGGFPCFPAGTLIETATRMVPIEEVKKGDLVATHKRRLRKVLSVMRRDDADLLEVKITGIPSIKTTDEHPFYVRKRTRVWNNFRRGYDYSFGAPEWVEAKNLTGEHYAALPMDDEAKCKRDLKTPEFWYLVGRWLGDGWIVDYPRTEVGRSGNIRKVIICTAAEDAENLQRSINAAGFHSTPAKERTVVKFHICSHEFVDFLEEFGRRADGKQIPRWMFSTPRWVQQSVWKGWMDADGYQEGTFDKWAATSINRALSLGMARLARNVYGRVACVRRSRVPERTVIEGRTVNQKTQYHTVLSTKNHGLTFVEDGFAWVKVKWVKPTGEKATVHNIEVEEDNSYVAEGVVVHNCQPFSLAGVSKKNSLGRPHGFEDETQGTLFFDIERIIAAKRPAAFLLENVRNLTSHDKGKTFDVILRTLTDRLGYTVSWKIMDGSAWVPQRRPRIVIVGFRDGLEFDFGEVHVPDRRVLLRDILHREGEEGSENCLYAPGGVVLPKYTLTDRLWEYLQSHARKHAEKGNGFGFGLVGPDDVARTLSARYYKDGAEILIRQEGRNPRRLTPRECARLMGFDQPGGSRMIIPVSDGQAYKQFGNSVVTPMFEAVAKAMVPHVLHAIDAATKAAA